MSRTCIQVDVRDVVVGDVIVVSFRGFTDEIEVVEAPVIVKDLFGRDELDLLCHRLEDGAVGHVRFGLEARAWIDVARLHDDEPSDTFEPDTLAEARGLA